MEDFKGMGDQHKAAADLIFDTGNLLVIAVEKYRDAIENRLKAVLVKQGKFDPRGERQGGDKHHSLRNLADKTGIALKKQTLIILEESPALQKNANSNVTYEGTRTVISYNTWAHGNNNAKTQELIAECKIYKAVCEEIWEVTEDIFK